MLSTTIQLKSRLRRSLLLLSVMVCVLLPCASISTAQEDSPSPATELNLTEEEKAWLAAHPVITSPSAVHFEMAPIYTHDEMGVYTGLGVDIAEIVAKRLGIEVEWVSHENHIQAIDALINWKVDFISFMGENMPGEGSRYQLSNFFQQFPSTLVVPKTNTGEVTIDDLRGKRVAGVKYWPDTEYLLKNHPEIEVIEVKSVQDGLQKVAFGEAEACIVILPLAAYEIRAGGITTLRIGGKLDRVFRQGFGIRSDWPEFVSIVNKALATMSEKEKTDLYNKWVPVLVSDGIDFEKLLRWGLPIALAVIIVFSVVIYWNRKLAKANLAERKAREDAKRKADEALKAQRKMEKAVEEEKELRKKQVRFVDMISHEYRTPVAVLQTNLDIMQIKDGLSSSKMDTNFSNMQHAITRLTELLDTGLNEGQLSSGDIKATYRAFSLLGCIQETAEHVCSLWPDRKVSFEADPTDPVSINGDQQLLKTTFLNLMENGLKYSAADTPVSVMLERVNGQAVVSVTDKGIGIPGADQERVFEKYFRADHGSEASGTGVGLFLVKKAIELHDGTIEIESERNMGTKMIVTLPLDDTEIESQ